MSETTTRDKLKDSLAEVDFPASKDDLLDAAIRKGDPTAVQALRGIPPVEYGNLTEVLGAVTFEDDGQA